MKSRNKQIVNLRRKGWIYEELAIEFNLTRERIRQIINLVGEKGVAEDCRKAKLEKKMKVCQQCKKKYLPTRLNQKVCSAYCRGLINRKSIGGRLNPYPKTTPKHDAWRYKMLKKYNPKLIKKYNKTAQDKLRNDPVRYKKFLKYQRDYSRKNKLWKK